MVSAALLQLSVVLLRNDQRWGCHDRPFFPLEENPLFKTLCFHLTGQFTAAFVSGFLRPARGLDTPRSSTQGSRVIKAVAPTLPGRGYGSACPQVFA